MTDISQGNFQNRIEMRFPAIKSSASVLLNLQDFVTLRLQSALPRNKQFHLQGKAALPPPLHLSTAVAVSVLCTQVDMALLMYSESTFIAGRQLKNMSV